MKYLIIILFAFIIVSCSKEQVNEEVNYRIKLPDELSKTMKFGLGCTFSSDYINKNNIEYNTSAGYYKKLDKSSLFDMVDFGTVTNNLINHISFNKIYENLNQLRDLIDIVIEISTNNYSNDFILMKKNNPKQTIIALYWDKLSLYLTFSFPNPNVISHHDLYLSIYFEDNLYNEDKYYVITKPYNIEEVFFE